MKVDDSFFSERIAEEKFNHWTRQYTNQLEIIQKQINEIESVIITSRFQLRNYAKLYQDLREAYELLDILQKQRFIRIVFDNELYRFKGAYRTPKPPLLYRLNELKTNYLEVGGKFPGVRKLLEFPISSP